MAKPNLGILNNEYTLYPADFGSHKIIFIIQFIFFPSGDKSSIFFNSSK